MDSEETSDEPREGPLRRAAFFPLRKFGAGGPRFRSAVLIAAVMACGLGLIGYGLVSPEIPFAQAPVTLVGEVRADTMVKINGRILCDCTKAIDREEVTVGASGRNWNATYEPFEVSDPSGHLHIDTTSITRMTAGPSGGDWMNTDWVTIYGSVYDQGNGVLALRAQMVAKAPDDTPAKYADWALASAALGGLLIAYVLTDRLLFGSAAS